MSKTKGAVDWAAKKAGETAIDIKEGSISLWKTFSNWISGLFHEYAAKGCTKYNSVQIKRIVEYVKTRIDCSLDNILVVQARKLWNEADIIRYSGSKRTANALTQYDKLEAFENKCNDVIKKMSSTTPETILEGVKLFDDSQTFELLGKHVAEVANDIIGEDSLDVEEASQEAAKGKLYREMVNLTQDRKDGAIRVITNAKARASGQISSSESAWTKTYLAEHNSAKKISLYQPSK